MDEYDIAQLPTERLIVFVASTTGQACCQCASEWHASCEQYACVEQSQLTAAASCCSFPKQAS